MLFEVLSPQPVTYCLKGFIHYFSNIVPQFKDQAIYSNLLGFVNLVTFFGARLLKVTVDGLLSYYPRLAEIEVRDIFFFRWRLKIRFNLSERLNLDSTVRAAA